MNAHPATAVSQTTAPLARLRSFVGRDVTITTANDRYQGRLSAVHANAVWLELRDDCLVAVTAPVLSVAHRNAQ